MMYIKKKQTKRGIRYYRESRGAMQAFPISKQKAEEMLASGEACLVDYFYTPNDIVAYAKAQEANKQEMLNTIAKQTADLQKQVMINNFVNEILETI